LRDKPCPWPAPAPAPAPAAAAAAAMPHTGCARNRWCSSRSRLFTLRTRERLPRLTSSWLPAPVHCSSRAASLVTQKMFDDNRRCHLARETSCACSAPVDPPQ
jgi:hypothetical protein